MALTARRKDELMKIGNARVHELLECWFYEDWYEFTGEEGVDEDEESDFLRNDFTWDITVKDLS